MPCVASVFLGTSLQNWDWSNWSGRVKMRLPLADRFQVGPLPTFPYPTLEHLTRLVLTASQAGQSTHAIGSGWSFNDQAVGDQRTIFTEGMNRRLLHVVGETIAPPTPVHALARGPGLTDEWRSRQADRLGARKLVHFEAGIKLYDLIQQLDAMGLALRTLGGACGQSLAGVVNTSVHGGDQDEPAFPGVVRAIHLVTAGGRELWLERSSDPITTDERLRPVLSCPGTEIVRDDELFSAALVGLGRFGVVYAYVIEVRPQFWLAGVATKVPLRAAWTALLSRPSPNDRPFDALLALLATDPGPAGIPESRSGRPPSFFQLIFNTRNPPYVWAERRWETERRADSNVTQSADAPGDLIAGALDAAFRLPRGSQLVDRIVAATMDGQMSVPATLGKVGRHAWLTAGVPTAQVSNYRGVSVEVIFGTDTTAYVDFLREAVEISPRFEQVGWISMRPSRSTDATLSMHRVSTKYAVSVEIAILGGMPGTEPLIAELQRRALAHGGRLHWGQANDEYNPERVQAQYGTQLRRWQRALHRVSGGSTVFSNHFTRRTGLEPAAADTIAPLLCVL